MTDKIEVMAKETIYLVIWEANELVGSLRVIFNSLGQRLSWRLEREEKTQEKLDCSLYYLTLQ